ncbi:hypothetical protein D3C80_2116370 [compost metagenome]
MIIEQPQLEMRVSFVASFVVAYRKPGILRGIYLAARMLGDMQEHLIARLNSDLCA